MEQLKLRVVISYPNSPKVVLKSIVLPLDEAVAFASSCVSALTYHYDVSFEVIDYDDRSN